MPRTDILLSQDQYARLITELYQTLVNDKFFETMRGDRHDWLLTMRPLGFSPGPLDENPLDDGNASRTTIGPTNLTPHPAITIGPAHSDIPWVQTIIEQWQDFDTFVLADEPVPKPHDTTFPWKDFATFFETVRRATETQLDTLSFQGQESGVTHLPLFITQRIDSRTQSLHARVNARYDNTSLHAGIDEYWRDTIS